jgi:predicted AAA+ superfamily ATPase
MIMKKRELYLERLISFRDTPELIKVITGVRRCGKASLLKLFAAHLRENYVPEENIVLINFEDFAYHEIDDAAKLHEFLTARLAKKRKTYILLDEVQLIPEWEKAVNSLRLNKDNDIYITGSNAHLLSGKLSTLLSGRYVEIKTFPLSFTEFIHFHNLEDELNVNEAFTRFLKTGGYPSLIDISDNEEMIRDYLSGVLNTIIVKDIATFNEIRDIDMLRKVIDFVADNIGHPISAGKIAGYIVSTGRKISADTVDSYLGALEDAFVFYRAKRYNLKGKAVMKTNHKFYIVDLGLRNAIRGTARTDFGSSLENVVYLDLLRRGYRVTFGKYEDLEVDFIAERYDTKMYIQVSASIIDDATRERELRSLQKIKDNYPKIVLTMDKLPSKDLSGIRHEYIPDFLLGAE